MIPRLGIVAGAGPLPQALYDLDGDAVLIRFAGVETSARGRPMVQARLDRLSILLEEIRRYGVRDLVWAGRMAVPLAQSDDPESQRFAAGLADGAGTCPDEGPMALIRWAEGHDYQVLSPQALAPNLMVPTGTVYGRRATPEERSAAIAGLRALAEPGATAVVAAAGDVIAVEGPEGLAAMLAGLARRPEPRHPEAVLAVAPWTGQDLRAQMPALGPEEIDLAADAGLAGVIIAAGGVAVVQQDAVRARVAARGLCFEAL